MIVSGLLKLRVALPAVERLFVPITFIIKPSMYERMALVVLELIVAPCSVRSLLPGLYFTVPLTPSILERSLQLAVVAGSYVFSHEDPKAAIHSLKELTRL